MNELTTKSRKDTKEKKKPMKELNWKRWKRLGIIVVAAVLGQLAADAIHSAYVAGAAARWEASIERDANGVLKGCEAYDLAALSESASNGAILFVHGINASPRHYDFLAPALAEQGLACRVMRLPGFAEPLPQYARSTADDWQAAVAKELADLRAKHERVGVVAHSLGGAVTIGVLLDDPKAADFAVLLAPAVAVSDARSPLLSTRTWNTIASRLLWFTDTLYSPFGLDCHDPNRTDHPGRTPFTPIVIVKELFSLMDSNRPRAGEFQTPLLMILSENDTIIDASAAEAYFKQIVSERKSLKKLDRSSHEIPLDWEWQQVVDWINVFSKPSP